MENGARHNQNIQSYTEPYPTSIQTPIWPMEYPNHQPHSEYQSHEFYPPTYQPDYSNRYSSYQSHLHQTYPSGTGDYCPTWSDEGWQPQNTQFYLDQTCPDRPQHQPHPQQSFGSTSEENYYTNSTEGKIEGVTEFQPNVQNCTRTEAKTVMEMQHTYEEQQSHMDNMIRQVALLTEMIKEIKENRAKSEVNRSVEMEEYVKEEKPANAEEESEALLEEAESEEIEADEERVQTEEKSMTTPPDNEVSKVILEEARDEPRGNEEAIECDEKIDNTPFYLQTDKVHAPKKRVKEFTAVMKEERIPEKRPPPVIDQSEGCSYRNKGEPEWKVEDRSRRKAARGIYWVQLQPWPEPQKMGKHPHSGVCPKENKKVLGTYRHHRKIGMPCWKMVPSQNSVDSKKRGRVRIPK